MIVLTMRDSRTVAFEVGLQNGGMATGLAFNVLHSPAAALASATFGHWNA
jgi:BASS family bile acid:Na+ symporter